MQLITVTHVHQVDAKSPESTKTRSSWRTNVPLPFSAEIYKILLLKNEVERTSNSYSWYNRYKLHKWNNNRGSWLHSRVPGTVTVHWQPVVLSWKREAVTWSWPCACAALQSACLWGLNSPLPVFAIAVVCICASVHILSESYPVIQLEFDWD